MLKDFKCHIVFKFLFLLQNSSNTFFTGCLGVHCSALTNANCQGARRIFIVSSLQHYDEHLTQLHVINKQTTQLISLILRHLAQFAIGLNLIYLSRLPVVLGGKKFESSNLINSIAGRISKLGAD